MTSATTAAAVAPVLGRRWSLRSQMAAAVVLCLVLFALVAGALTVTAYRDDRDDARQQLSALAGAAADELAAAMRQTETLLGGIVAQEPVAALDPARCQPVLQGFSVIGEAHLVLVDGGGRTLCSSLPDRAPGGNEYAGAGWVADVRAAQGPVRMEPMIDPVTARRSVVIAVPAPPGVSPAPAALAAVLSVDSFIVNLVGPLEESRGAVLLVVGREPGSVVASSPPGLVEEGAEPTPFRPPAGKRSFELKFPDDVRRLYHRAAVPDLGWNVYAGLPTSAAFAPAREAVGQAAVLAGAVLFALATLSLVLHRQVVRPARALTSAILSARGDPAAPAAPVQGPAELARIALEFNALQRARQDDEQAVRALNGELADRIGELDETRAELQRALVRFTQMQEEQRRLVAKAIHDHTVQAVTATLWSLDDLADRDDDPARLAVIEQARANLHEAVSASRSLLMELRPPLLDELGLPAAVEQQLTRLADDWGLKVSLESDVKARFPRHVETLAFRTTEEALRNVRQHARAQSVKVRIAAGGDSLDVTVDDDGVGVVPGAANAPSPEGRLGLVSMRETITMAGGRFTVGPGPDGGTRLAFSLPVEASEAASR